LKDKIAETVFFCIFAKIRFNMKKPGILLSLLLISVIGLAYGPIGHRAVAKIAYDELKPKAKKQIDDLLGREGLIYSSTWADEVRSDPDNYKYSYPWHYQNLAEGMSTDDLKKLWDNPASEGEHLFFAIQTLQKRLIKDKNDVEALKFLIHFVADLHQPMHLGRKDDLGGNKVSYTWFGDKTNIHSLWDSYLIENKKMSYTELASYLQNTQEKEKEKLMNETILQGIERGYAICNLIYLYDREDTNNYRYVYRFDKYLDEMLYRSGIRLALILNEIYR
jgi:hypothetical protein